MIRAVNIVISNKAAVQHDIPPTRIINGLSG